MPLQGSRCVVRLRKASKGLSIIVGGIILSTSFPLSPPAHASATTREVDRGGLITLRWDDHPIGRFPVAINGVNNETTTRTGNFVELSYVAQKQGFPSSVTNGETLDQGIVYQMTGSASEGRLAPLLKANGNYAQALDIGTRIVGTNGVLDGIKASDLLGEPKVSVEDGQTYYQIDLKSRQGEIVYLISSTVLHRRLYVCAVVCSARKDRYKRDTELQRQLKQVQGSFRVR